MFFIQKNGLTMHHPNGAAQPYLLTHIEWHFRAPNGKWHFAKWISIQIASLKFINVCFSDLVIKKRTSHHDEKKTTLQARPGPTPTPTPPPATKMNTNTILRKMEQQQGQQGRSTVLMRNSMQWKCRCSSSTKGFTQIDSVRTGHYTKRCKITSIVSMHVRTTKYNTLSCNTTQFENLTNCTVVVIF